MGTVVKKILLTICFLYLRNLYAQEWTSPKDTIYGVINSFCQYNGRLYVGGSTISIGPSEKDNYILAWDDFKWIPIGKVSDSSVSTLKKSIESYKGVIQEGKVVRYGKSPAHVNTFALYKGDLYVGGDFRNINGEPFYCIARWNDKKWSMVSTGVDTSCENGGTIHELTVYNGELYAAGSFDRIGGVSAHNIAKWNGKNWMPLGKGLNNAVFTIAGYNGKIYAGGMFDTAGEKRIKHIARWDGKNWDTVGNGCDYEVFKLINYNGRLYARGTFDWKKQYNNFYAWNDTAWNVVAEEYHYEINAFTVFNGDLYVASSRDYNGKFNGIRAFKLAGNEFKPLGGAIKGVDVYTINVYNGFLYLGGNFNAFLNSFPYKGGVLRSPLASKETQ